MQVVYVEWLDSRCVSSASAASARRESLLLMSTAGVLVGEDDQVLRLALDWWGWDDDGDWVERYRNVAIIPKAAIQRRQQWDVLPPPVNAIPNVNDAEGNGLTYRVGVASPEGKEMIEGILDQCHDSLTPWW